MSPLIGQGFKWEWAAISARGFNVGGNPVHASESLFEQGKGARARPRRRPPPPLAPRWPRPPRATTAGRRQDERERNTPRPVPSWSVGAGGRERTRRPARELTPICSLWILAGIVSEESSPLSRIRVVQGAGQAEERLLPGGRT